MNIQIANGLGEGRTLLSSFDHAIQDAGVYNYNLLYLSSIIPPHSSIEEVEAYDTPDSEYGHKLYVVMAQEQSDVQGTFIGAGIGWYQYGDDNRGLFVEHHVQGASESEVKQTLENLIVDSLHDLCDFRELEFNPDNVQMKLCHDQVQERPKTVVVVAVFESEAWNS